MRVPAWLSKVPTTRGALQAHAPERVMAISWRAGNDPLNLCHVLDARRTHGGSKPSTTHGF
eukprot:5588592-Lingulodinium_polyedra.AAC.1